MTRISLANSPAMHKMAAVFDCFSAERAGGDLKDGLFT
jgi:hypothetical protein